ncbi:YidC/Oxa1 family membrane protein insertase [Phytoactinopolyspora halotolerans]|uniref:Membrane protein insertase YidC n=1 Tax=Phytoactinopolyspora halotolerans TaxID=1981512 RepID=A0A6L9SIH1_9ACTN|nr:YidC/Oxa1 family membrane protein insertase [Phytoactinopolyspora halotolerans]NEE04464.1 YidC/Oxa1 family membrane protein insertase [Phytoactinopolyspora halotolerans]
MYSFPPLAAAIGVLYTVVTALTTFLTPAVGTSSAAVAIVVLTTTIRLLLVPLARAQVRAERRRAELAPELRKLTRKYRHDPEQLRQEMAAFYARQGASPVAGCLPLLVQAPVFTVLYGLFLTSDVSGEANALLAHTLAGVPLGARLADITGLADLAVFAALLILLAGVAWFTRRQSIAMAAPGTADEPTQARIATLLRLLPFGTVLIAAFVPLAAGVYLLTSSSWTLGERIVLRRGTAGRSSAG